MQVYLKLFKDIIYEGSAPASLDEKGNVVDLGQPFYYLANIYDYKIKFDNNFECNIVKVRDYTNYDFDFQDDNEKKNILEKLNRKEFERAKNEKIKIDERIKILPNSLSLKKFPSSIEEYMNHSIEWFYSNGLIPPELDGDVIQLKDLIEWNGLPEELKDLYKQLQNHFLEPSLREIDFASHFQINRKTVRSIYNRGKINFLGKQNELAYLIDKLNSSKKIINKNFWEVTANNFLLSNAEIDQNNLRKSLSQPPRQKDLLDKIITSILNAF